MDKINDELDDDLIETIYVRNDEESITEAEKAIKKVRQEERRNKTQFMKAHGIEIVWKKYAITSATSSVTSVKFNRHLTPEEEQELGVLMCWQPYVTKHGKSSWNVGDSTVLEITEEVF